MREVLLKARGALRLGGGDSAGSGGEASAAAPAEGPGGLRFLLGGSTPTFADVCLACALSGFMKGYTRPAGAGACVAAAAGSVPVGGEALDGGRLSKLEEVRTHVALAAEFADLLAWRDAFTAAHRKPRPRAPQAS